MGRGKGVKRMRNDEPRVAHKRSISWEQRLFDKVKGHWKSHLDEHSQPNCSCPPGGGRHGRLRLPVPPNPSVYWLPAELIPKYHSTPSSPTKPSSNHRLYSLFGDLTDKILPRISSFFPICTQRKQNHLWYFFTQDIFIFFNKKKTMIGNCCSSC